MHTDAPMLYGVRPGCAVARPCICSKNLLCSWLDCWLAGWLDDGLARCRAGRLAAELADWLPGWMVGWRAKVEEKMGTGEEEG